MKSDMSMNLKILSRMVKSVRGLILADEYTLDDEVRFRRLLLDLEIVLDDSGKQKL